MTVEFTVTGLEGISLAGKAVRDAAKTGMQRAMLLTANQAKMKAPVDTGRLRSSITTLVRWEDGDHTLAGYVGSNVDYAPAIEYGTGTQTDGEGGSGKRHWPPGGALDTWARRHGFSSGAAVARIIGMRGGLKPRRFLRGAFSVALISSTIRDWIKREMG